MKILSYDFFRYIMLNLTEPESKSEMMEDKFIKRVTLYNRAQFSTNNRLKSIYPLN